jgi:hypothetical protein
VRKDENGLREGFPESTKRRVFPASSGLSTRFQHNMSAKNRWIPAIQAIFNKLLEQNHDFHAQIA